MNEAAPAINVFKAARIGELPCACDIVFWNAWVAKSKALVDMDDDGYCRYVCIEPGCVTNGGRMVPKNETLTLTQILTAY